FDKFSIMLYSFPASWTRNNFSAPRNDKLSDDDKTFVGSAQMYPKTNDPSDVTELKVAETTGVDAEIGRPGEQDLYKFTASTAGTYTIETEGPTDVFMRLFGPGSRTALIGEDDDSGQASNAMLTRALTP